MRAPALLAAALALVGCGGPDAPPEPGPPAETRAAALPADETPYFVLGHRGAGPSRADFPPAPLREDSAAFEAWRDSALVRTRGEFLRRVSFGNAETWQEADAAVRELTPPGQLPRHADAVMMLDRHLLRGPLDGAKVEALGRYTSALQRRGSDEGALVLWALRRLDGHWPDDRRRQAARAAADRLGAAFAVIAQCVGCTVDEALAGMWPERRRSSESLLLDMETVHRELTKLADGDTPMPR